MKKLLIGVIGGLWMGCATAATLDLTTAGAAGSINGAIFSSDDLSLATGTVSSNSFLGIRTRDFERRSAGSGGGASVERASKHALRWSNLDRVTLGRKDYFRLALDIDDDADRISWVDMQLYSTKRKDRGSPLGGKLKYDLRAGGRNKVLMDPRDFKGWGDGKFDVDILLPISILTGFAKDDFLYFFGAFKKSGHKFEKWFEFKENGVLVPVPPAVWLFGSGLGLLAWMRRKVA